MFFLPARTLVTSIFSMLIACSTANAAISPGRVANEEMQSKNIRVSLGTRALWNLRTYDIRINKTSIISGNSNFAITCQNGGVQLGGISYQSPLEIGSNGEMVFLEKNPFREKIIFYNNGRDQCLAVNELSLDKYVAGLINREMAPHWPLEALKAQAITARTYALYQKSQSGPKVYDVESTTQDQVYTGADSETEKSNQAVRETAGLILAWKNKPIKAFYHANCAGKTESPKAVWGNNYSYMQPVICEFHQPARAQTHWAYELTKENLIHSLRKISGLIPKAFGKIAWVQPANANSSQRIEKIALGDAQGKKIEVTTNQLREAVGNTRIRSTAFQMRQAGSQIQFYGSGFGHGVGMCQIGAREMARQGKTYRDILRYYYPLANLESL